MGFLDKVKAGAEQAAVKAREGVQEVQTRREIAHEYQELGRTAFDLAESGELSHAKLSEGIERIRTLNRELQEQKEQSASKEPATVSSAGGEPDASS